MELTENQSALILTTVIENGEIQISVASEDHKSMIASICTALARKLLGDLDFQNEIMQMINTEDS